MLGLGEPSAKKAKCDQQRVYNERRKEKPRKPQFRLNFQFGFGEEEEMRATNERFVQLRNMADLRSGRTNADFLTALMDRYEGKSCPDEKEMHSVEVQANAPRLSLSFMPKKKQKRPTSSVNGRAGKLPLVNKFCHQLGSKKFFFVCGQDSLAVLLQETATGCSSGSPYGFDGPTTMDGHVLRTELCCMNGHRIKWVARPYLAASTLQIAAEQITFFITVLLLQ